MTRAKTPPQDLRHEPANRRQLVERSLQEVDAAVQQQPQQKQQRGQGAAAAAPASTARTQASAEEAMRALLVSYMNMHDARFFSKEQQALGSGCGGASSAAMTWMQASAEEKYARAVGTPLEFSASDSTLLCLLRSFSLRRQTSSTTAAGVAEPQGLHTPLATFGIHTLLSI